MLALKALLAGTDRPLGDARQRQIEVAVGGKPVRTLVIPADQGEVMRQVNLTGYLPIPPGFAIDLEDLESLQSSGKIAKYQVTPRSAIIYLRALVPAAPLELVYHVRAMMPVKIMAPPARAYEYYNPDRQASTAPTPMTVATAK